MNNKTIEISVIVPAYKPGIYVGRLLNMYDNNIKNLNYDNGLCTEIIFVNDNPESIIEIPIEYRSREDIIIINNEHNSGIHASKVKGLQNARGKYVVFLDQDDMISPYYLKVQCDLVVGFDAVICNANIGNGYLYETYSLNALDLNKYRNGQNGIISLGQVLLLKDSIPEEWMMELSIDNAADDLLLIYLMILK